VAFERSHQVKDPDLWMSEIRVLKVTHASGDITSASELVVSGTGPMLDGGAGRGMYLPTSPVFVDGGRIAYLRLDGNTHRGAVIVRSTDGKEQVLVPQRTTDIWGIRADRSGDHILAQYEDEVRMVRLTGGQDTLLRVKRALAAW
jgi:hypothetical protein